MVVSARWKSHVTRMLACLVLAASISVSAMDIRVSGNQLVMTGHISGNEIAQLRDILPANPQLDTVVLRDSTGGDLWTAMRLGEIFEEKGFRTAASGHCMSACVLIFLGGRVRQFADGKPGNRTFLAVHTPVYSMQGDSSPIIGTPAGRAQGEMVYWMLKRMGPRADRALIEGSVANNHPQGFTYFFDYIRNKRADGISVFRCKGPEKNKVGDCETISGTNAMLAALITSEEILAVRD